ncbi:hypothetical protein Bca52824_018036 [Brassica carinata]|uniref:Uncharacterized protein n=1 Tax=Brassica carinata TaxID=52824 RepID=A0A8X7VPB6_BRACI|nr:hypothetical protein Bca52824_018036 [Brassica carinata]
MYLTAKLSRFRGDGDGDGQEAVDATMVPRSFYPGNIFSEEGPLEKMRIRPSVVNGQDCANVERTRSTTKSVEEILRNLTAHGVTFIIPKADQRPWSPPKGYQCIYESYFQNDTRLWFPIPRIAGTSLSVRSFEELTSVSITEDGLVSTRMRPSYNVVTGYPSKTTDSQRFYFYVKSNRSAFKEPPRSSYRVLWNAEMVGHPNVATYSEDWKQRTRTIALQKQDCWGSFTRDRIQRSIDRIANQEWVSEASPHIKSPANKRLSLFSRVEQKEINRARGMKELTDLSRIMAARTSAKKGGSGGEMHPSGSKETATASAAAKQAPKEGTSKKKTVQKKKRKRDTEALEEPHEVGPSEQTRTSDGPKKREKKKRKKGDVESETPRVAAEDPEELSSEDVPLKKRRRKKDAVAPRPSSVCEEEFQVLVPDAISEGRTSGDDKNQTIASRIRSREWLLLEENPSEVAADNQQISENLINSLIPEGRRGHPSEGNPSHVPEGETREDRIRFEFSRELPLSFYPEDCGRLIRSVKGGPNLLPPVGDLIFEEEYGHAACSSVRIRGYAREGARDDHHDIQG